MEMAGLGMGSRKGALALGLALSMLVGVVGWVPSVRAEGDEGPKRFDTPVEAAKALILAAARNDTDALLALYGTVGKELVQDGKDPTVRAERKGFAAAAREQARLRTLEDGSRELIVGRSEWPFPLLIVQGDGTWYFDAEEGKEEILLRRIGRNELNAIRVAEIYGDAQVVYASEDRDGDGVREYAQRILSTPGQHDGLYWEDEDDDPASMSPLGPSVISLEEFLNGEDDKAVPYYGYYWKILKGQGDGAPGGAHSYVINGNMITGYGLVGVPAQYGSTGVMTFLVSHHGEIFQKDLGEDGLDVAKAMDEFNPDDTWTLVDPAAEEAGE